jgi:hypothetical protein
LRLRSTLSRDRVSAYGERSSVAAGVPDRGRGANPMADARLARTVHRATAAPPSWRSNVTPSPTLNAALRGFAGRRTALPIGPLAAPSSAATPADLLRVANVLGTRRAKALAASATLGRVHGMYARRRSPGPRGPRRPPRPTHGRRTLCARLHKRRWQRPQQRRLRAAMTRGAATRVTGNSRRHRTARRTPGRRIRANPPHPGPHFASGVDVSGSDSRRGVQSGGSSSPRPGVCAGALVTGVRRGLLEQVAGGGCDPCPVDSCPAE